MRDRPTTIELQHASGRSLHDQLCDYWRTEIAGGLLQAGEHLPSSRTLADALGVSRSTVSTAVEQLVAEGYLDVRQGRRPVVAARPGVSGREGHRPPRAGRAGIKLSRWASELEGHPWPFHDTAHPRPFLPGMADAREFPQDLWARCLRRAARRRRLNEPTQLNRATLQAALVRHLDAHRGVRAEARQVIVGPSAQSLLCLIARVAIDPGDVAWVEDPGYPGAWAALASTGAQVVGIPVDEHGLTLPDTVRLPRLIFTTPSHQYPTGRLMPINRRHAMLDLAEMTGSVVVEDDYDGEFHFDTRPVVSLQGLRRNDCVIYLGTFSKAMRPDIRAGYAVVPEALVAVFERAQRQTGQFVLPVVQDALADFIAEGHFEAAIRRMRRIYHARRDCIVRALQALPDLPIEVSPPSGGMQMLLRLPPAWDDRQVSDAAGAAGVTARPLSRHFFGAPTSSGLFLGFAAWNEQEIVEGVAALADVLSSTAARSS